MRPRPRKEQGTVSRKSTDIGCCSGLRLRPNRSWLRPFINETDVSTRRPRGQAAIFHICSSTLADTFVALIPPPRRPAVSFSRASGKRGEARSRRISELPKG